MPALSFDELNAEQDTGPSSAEVREQVQAARDIQQTRYNEKFRCNADTDTRAVRKFCKADEAGARILEQAIEQMGLSARAYDKVLRVSRTLADLEGAPDITEAHIAEAVQYRSMDREMV